MSMVQIVSDNFTRANENPLSDGGNWTIPAHGGGGGLKIVSDLCEPTANATSGFEYWSAAISAPSGTFPNDQYAEATVTTLTTPGTNDSYIGPMVRMSSGGTGVNGYIFYAARESGTFKYYILKELNGAATTLAGPTNHAISVGDVFRISVVGSTITGYINGSQIVQVTDTAIASGQPGLTLFTDTTILSNAQTSLWAAGANQCATPTFSPVAGTYINTQTITITGTASSTIYYTTDGSTPTESSASIASGSTISISSSCTVKAISSLTNYVDSAVGSAAYTINAATISGNCGAAGATVSYTGTASGSVTADGSGNYTISGLSNGSYTITPSLAGYVFSPTSSSQTVSGANITGVNFTATNLQVATSTISIVGGVATVSNTNSGLAGFAEYYTTDGSTPTIGSTPYTVPVTLVAGQTIKVLAVATGYLNSAIASATYNSYYSVPDCRVTKPNSATGHTVENTIFYDQQTSSNSAVPSVDSRTAGAPVDSRVNIPSNSRAPGTFGPNE